MPLPELITNSSTPRTATPLTTLGAAILSTSATSISTVAPAPAALRVSGQFRITVDSEIMLVTGGAGTTSWTVVRGPNLAAPDTCSATTHVIGTPLYNDLTAGALDARYAIVGTDGTVGGPGGTSVNSSIGGGGGGGGSTPLQVVTKSGNYTAVAADDVILCVTSYSGAFTVRLPTPVGRTRTMTVKHLSPTFAPVTVTTAAGSIDGAASIVLTNTSNSYSSITVVSDQTNWWIV